MASIQRFEDLEVWQQARQLSKQIYLVTGKDLFAKDFELKNQVRRASGSVMDNIAEGFERGGRGEFIQFLGIAKGSAGEVRSQLYRALDQQYINEENFNQLYEQANNIGKMIKGLISYLNKTEFKGEKYKNNSKS